MAIEYIGLRLDRKVHKKLREFEKKHKLEKSLSKTIALLLENFDEYAFSRKEAA